MSGAGATGLRVNPIWQKSARSRLRARHLLSWGVVTLSVTAFVAVIIYTTMTEQRLTTATDAAKAVLPAMVVIQAVLLMVFGTGAVAAGVSQERDEGLLDYQRMTPMRPTAKIFGYLFGLPVREYVLFAMTLPFVAIAAVISGFSLLTLAHFYLVFFTSVWVYHLTGLAAGMVSPKPRLASMVSVGLVAVLYFALPNLSRVGITFFEFLTIRPTFFGLLQQELPPHMRSVVETSGIDSFRDVPMFGGSVHPTVYSLLVQGFVIATLFSVVHRKWRNQTLHLFSKAGALLVFGGVVCFVLGSVWAMVVQEGAYRQIFEPFGDDLAVGPRLPETLELLLILFVLLCAAGYAALISAVTPSRFTTVEGWRRASKLGRSGLGLNSDAASSLPVALCMLAIVLGAGGALLARVGELGEYYEAGPRAWSVAVVGAAIVGPALFVQGMRELLGLRAFGLSMFVLWMLPFFSMMVMFAAFEAWVPGSYVGLACPPVLMVYSIGEMMQTTTPFGGVETHFLPPEIESEAPRLTVIGASVYAGAGLLAQTLRLRRRRAQRSLGLAGPVA